MRTIIMTGGTFGLGQVTAQRLGDSPDTRLIIGGRTTRLPLELASLDSVRQFARQVVETLGNTKIDALVFNAGLGFPTTARTVDGYESTFAVNHLGHYLLLRLLAPALAREAIVVLTTSNTHDPQFSPVAPFSSVDAQQLAHLDLGKAVRGSVPFESGFRAYATSKLCNLLTARAFEALPEARARRVRVIAYNPGYVPGTGLGRNLPSGALPAPPSALSPYFAEGMRLQAGELLADLALGRIVPPKGRLYASLVRGELTWPEPSELARRDEVARQLWQDSARLCALEV
ncbi:SDR family NAD(P)-dependent oxidoreductase [Pseudomonas gingeri]|nr:SDR family NAD(P)-dependent oxidoreductase [Pseudomonas gingeri]NWE30786.1 SDR family NAD(P)-dependent oxidoreductase [Pseudomonas gingeri]NWE58848.1 SDR family NAD(P)-dependent oxidoreductase [Pseudomonas gingeri]NWF02564.1 SDR family NAD(P)-dependent oxidoreductase [Pseudomonas gingeri]